MYIYTCIYESIYIHYIHNIHTYLKHKFERSMRELNKYKKKKLLKVKPQVEVLLERMCSRANKILTTLKKIKIVF